MTAIEKVLAASDLLKAEQWKRRVEREQIIAASEGPYHICKCGRIAIPNQYNCTSCASR